MKEQLHDVITNEQWKGSNERKWREQSGSDVFGACSEFMDVATRWRRWSVLSRTTGPRASGDELSLLHSWAWGFGCSLLTDLYLYMFHTGFTYRLPVSFHSEGNNHQITSKLIQASSSVIVIIGCFLDFPVSLRQSGLIVACDLVTSEAD